MTEKEKILFIKTNGMKAWEEHCRNNRVENGMNTGTREHESKKHKIYNPKHKPDYNRDEYER